MIEHSYLTSDRNSQMADNYIHVNQIYNFFYIKDKKYTNWL